MDGKHFVSDEKGAHLNENRYMWAGPQKLRITSGNQLKTTVNEVEKVPENYP